MQSFLCVTLLVVSQISGDLKDRKPHPFAPSLPLLTKDEYAKIDAVIERFIQADIGKLKGAEAKRAVEDFNKLGPEAIFNLIDGFNRAANLESSCPAVIIGRKVSKVLNASDDIQLLTFAKDNVGAGVTAKRHSNTLQDLQFGILLRKNALARKVGGEKSGGAKVGSMSLADLEKAASKERGAQLKAILAEAEKRNGQKAADILINGLASSDSSIAKLSQGLLAKNMSHQDTNVLKEMLKHNRPDVRKVAATAVGAKKLPFGAELIPLLEDRSDDVRQATRQALVQIAGVDHGLNVERWRQWLSNQK